MSENAPLYSMLIGQKKPESYTISTLNDLKNVAATLSEAGRDKLFKSLRQATESTIAAQGIYNDEVLLEHLYYTPCKHQPSSAGGVITCIKCGESIQEY